MEYEIVPFVTPSFDEPTPPSDFQKVGASTTFKNSNTATIQHPNESQFYEIKQSYTATTDSTFTEGTSMESSIAPSLDLASGDSVNQYTFSDHYDERDDTGTVRTRESDITSDTHSRSSRTIAPDTKKASDNNKQQTQGASLKVITDLFYATMKQTKNDPNQRAIADLFFKTMNQTKGLLAAAPSTDETASLSLNTTYDDSTVLTGVDTNITNITNDMKEQPTTAKHSNKSSHLASNSKSAFQYDEQSLGCNSMSNVSYSNLGEEGVYASRVSRLHEYGRAQIQIRREIQFIDCLEHNKRELMFNLRLQEKKKREKSSAPPLPPLQDRGRRIHDTYATKKNDAGRKLRNHIERRNEARAQLRKIDWK
jgi:hypothetical protein